MTLGTGRNISGAVKPDAISVDSYEPDLFAKRYTEIPTNMQMRCDYTTRTDGQPVYLGYAPKGLASSSTGWLIQKYTYDVSDRATLRQSAYTSWDLRADGGTTYE